MKSNLRVGIAGLGAIGMAIARRLEAGVPGLALTAVAGRDDSVAQARLAASPRGSSLSARFPSIAM